MMKGDRSASGQQAQGNDLPISDAAGGKRSVGSAVTCAIRAGNVKANAQCPVNNLDRYFILLEFYILFLQVTLHRSKSTWICFPRLRFQV